MSDHFILNVIKNPFSFPIMLFLFFIFFTLACLKISIEGLKGYKNKIGKIKTLSITISILLFILSCIFLFYKMTEIPPSGLDIDDAMYVVSAYFLKNLGHDSTLTSIPYYPITSIKYHETVVWEVGQRALSVYLQTFLQYFVKPGFYSLRLECNLIIILTSISIIYTFSLLKNRVEFCLLLGALFNLLPWTRILARITPETTAYCFGAACFLFSLIYLLSKKDFLAMLFYLSSLVMFFQSYTPALMFAPLCMILIPILAVRYTPMCWKTRNIAIISGIVLLTLIYFQFKGEVGYKYNLERAGAVSCLQGLNTLNITQIINGLLEKGHIYIANYLGYFSPQFLFTSGDSNLRHNTNFGGQLFFMLCIAFYTGFFYLIEKRKENWDLRVVLFFLLLSALPYSICLEGALNAETKLPLHALRSSCMLPVVTLVTGLGLIKIFNKNKLFFVIYIIAICSNIYLFYSNYFSVYPFKLGNHAVDDPGLRELSKRAVNVLEKSPEKKLFYNCTPVTVAYHNIEKIGLDSLFKGNGILSNVYDYKNRGAIPLEKGDLILVQENFDYNSIGKKYKFISRTRHPYLPNNAFGSSLLEITE